MRITIIVAAAENGVIGKDNGLVWRLPDDMKFFRDATMGHCVVTGRRNYESIPEKFRPLPGRTNIVVTRRKDYHAPGAVVVTSPEAAIEEAQKRGEEECFIIGGGEIYRQFLPLANRVLLTRVHASPGGDTYFHFSGEGMGLESEKRHAADAAHAHSFTFQDWIRK